MGYPANCMYMQRLYILTLQLILKIWQRNEVPGPPTMGQKLLWCEPSQDLSLVQLLLQECEVSLLPWLCHFVNNFFSFTLNFLHVLRTKRFLATVSAMKSLGNIQKAGTVGVYMLVNAVSSSPHPANFNSLDAKSSPLRKRLKSL